MKRKLKNIFTIMTMVTVLGLTGCGNDNKKIDTAKDSDNTTEAETTTESDKQDDEEKTEETEITTEDEAIKGDDEKADEQYVDLIDRIYALILEGDVEDYTKWEGVPMGIQEMIAYRESDEILNEIGYNLIDLNGDGQDELLIGYIGGTETNPESMDTVYGVYTITDGNINLVLEGWTRNAYFLMDDNSLLNQGSGGVTMFIFGTYNLTEDGRDIIENEYYYSDSTDGVNVVYFQSLSHQNAKEISEEEFFNRNDELLSHVVKIDYIPFATWDGTSGQNPSSADYLSVKLVEDVSDIPSNYQTFIISESQFSSEVLFTPRDTVKNFKIYSLEYVDVAMTGDVVFATNELYSDDELKASEPLMVSLDFPGDIPSYGISYEDESGNTIYRSLNLSGMDGSLVLDYFIAE